MLSKHFKRFFCSILSILFLLSGNFSVQAAKLPSIEFVLLTSYKANMDIGDTFYLGAITSNGKLPTWKSSSSKIASVNTYGKVTAKSSGTVTITAKIKGAEASCKITVNQTEITLSQKSASIEHGESFLLTAQTSNGSKVTFRTSKKSVATVDETGLVTGQKPGEAIITVLADGQSKTCKVTVKKPKVTLNKSSVTLYRNETIKLTAKVSSRQKPVWKSNKKSVAIVEEDGTVTAIKNGVATITATVDGVSKTCTITVKKPVIRLNTSNLTLKEGESTRLIASISSSNLPTWSSSNPSIADVDEKGTITAYQKGKAYIYAQEDGTKVRCIITVTN